MDPGGPGVHKLFSARKGHAQIDLAHCSHKHFLFAGSTHTSQCGSASCNQILDPPLDATDFLCRIKRSGDKIQIFQTGWHQGDFLRSLRRIRGNSHFLVVLPRGDVRNRPWDRYTVSTSVPLIKTWLCIVPSDESGRGPWDLLPLCFFCDGWRSSKGSCMKFGCCFAFRLCTCNSLLHPNSFALRQPFSHPHGRRPLPIVSCHLRLAPPPVSPKRLRPPKLGKFLYLTPTKFDSHNQGFLLRRDCRGHRGSGSGSGSGSTAVKPLQVQFVSPLLELLSSPTYPLLPNTSQSLPQQPLSASAPHPLTPCPPGPVPIRESRLRNEAHSTRSASTEPNTQQMHLGPTTQFLCHNESTRLLLGESKIWALSVSN